MSKYPTTNGYYVYGHRTPRHQWYIGMSQMQPKDRWMPSLYKGTALETYIKEYGWNNIQHHVFIGDLTKREAELLEDELITRYRTEGLCINKRRSGGRERDNKKKYDKQWYEDKREHILEQKKYYRQTNAERLKEYDKQYDAQRLATLEGKIYNRVKSYNHRHPDRAIETPMEAKQKYLDYGYIPDYIKNDDLQ